MTKYNITLDDFARSFGTDIEDIREKCIGLIDNHDFSYMLINGYEYDQLILHILKKIEEDRQIIGAPERKQVWSNGWEENYHDFIDSNYDLDKLIPKFIRYGQPIRYNLTYIKPSDPKFEFNYYSVFRQWLFKKYLAEYENMYEFGCGTGFNLVTLAQLYPDKNLYGLDFVPYPVKLINKIAEHYKYNLTGHLFDMISPNKFPLSLKENSAIFTIGSIEQLAGRFEKFIKYLLEQHVSLCIHIEPVIELYNENNLVDYLAIKFQEKRGYTKGFLPYLKKLESHKMIEILKAKRLFFGSLYMEGYNCIIWRPN